MKKLMQVRQHEKVFLLTWLLTNFCSRHCGYCNPNLHAGKLQKKDQRVFAFARELIRRYPKMHASFSGGEPTLDPHLLELTQIFDSANVSTGVTTNAVRSLEYLDQLTRNLRYICLSYHPEEPERDLIEKAIACAKNTKTTVRIMMDARHWEKALAFYQECAKYLEFSTEPVRVMKRDVENPDWHYQGADYTPEQMQILSELKTIYRTNDVRPAAPLRTEFYYDDGSVDLDGYPIDLLNQKLTHFKGWSCNIGLDSLYINYEGSLRRGNCREGKKLGNIFEAESIQWPKSAVICHQEECFSTTDVFIDKVRLNEFPVKSFEISDWY